jgi:glycosyltransferase involved in cell wall biosynthesis
MLVVVIPTKNRLELLKAALQSVFDQEFLDYRVVIINDGSTDGTGEYLASFNNPRIEIITHWQSKGVNASRNEAFKKMRPNEWIIPLDDDDVFFPGAFELIAKTLKNIPENIQIAQFSTVIITREKEYHGGRDFLPNEQYYDLSYEELMTDIGHRMRGEPRSVFRWTLFPKYLFSEEINGYEGEWWIKVAKDKVGIRIFNTKPVISIDWAHSGEHLSDTAARDNPKSFAMAHSRIFDEHSEFLLTHPSLALKRAEQAIKVSIKAHEWMLVLKFSVLYLVAFFRKLLS